jgi:hypothetical protein
LTLSAARPLEVFMTRPSPVRLLSGVAFLVLLSSSAGCGTGVDPASDAAAASVATGERSTSSAAAGTTAAPEVGNQGNPGGPGADPADGGGGGGGGGVAHGNPGAPGDVAVFEERGVSYAEFRDGSAKTVCVDEGKCTLAPPHQQAGETPYSDLTQCPIEGMDYSGGTHQNADGRDVFLEGATVTVTVSCLRFTDPDSNGIPGDQSSDGSTSDGTTTDGTMTDSPAPDTAEQPQG